MQRSNDHDTVKLRQRDTFLAAQKNSVVAEVMILLRQIPVADLRELAHLTGREVKTLFS